MGILDGLENVLGMALAPFEEADRLLGEGIEMLGEGTVFIGQEAEQFGKFVAGLADKVAALQQRLRKQ
jgi:hypothetical protein